MLVVRLLLPGESYMPKIVRFHETGGPEVLKLEEVPVDEPGTGEIRLKVEAIGLNNAEMLFRRGHYVTEPEYPARLGIEAAGVVDSVGPEVSGVAGNFFAFVDGGDPPSLDHGPEVTLVEAIGADDDGQQLEAVLQRGCCQVIRAT